MIDEQCRGRGKGRRYFNIRRGRRGTCVEGGHGSKGLEREGIEGGSQSACACSSRPLRRNLAESAAQDRDWPSQKHDQSCVLIPNRRRFDAPLQQSGSSWFPLIKAGELSQRREREGHWERLLGRGAGQVSSGQMINEGQVTNAAEDSRRMRHWDAPSIRCAPCQ